MKEYRSMMIILVVASFIVTTFTPVKPFDEANLLLYLANSL